MIDYIGPSNCSRANNRRPQDGTRYVSSLKKRIKEIENIAQSEGFIIIVARLCAARQGGRIALVGRSDSKWSSA